MRNSPAAVARAPGEMDSLVDFDEESVPQSRQDYNQAPVARLRGMFQKIEEGCDGLEVVAGAWLAGCPSCECDEPNRITLRGWKLCFSCCSHMAKWIGENLELNSSDKKRVADDRLDLEKEGLFVGSVPRVDVESIRLVGLAKQEVKEFPRNAFGRGCARIAGVEGEPAREIPVRSERFKDWLASRYFQIENVLPTSRALSLAQRILDYSSKDEGGGLGERTSWFQFVMESFALDVGSWKGTMRELFERLIEAGPGNADYEAEGWPRNPRHLSSMIRLEITELEAMGVQIEILGKKAGHGGRLIKISHRKAGVRVCEHPSSEKCLPSQDVSS